jgi:hypothetical protein
MTAEVTEFATPGDGANLQLRRASITRMRARVGRAASIAALLGGLCAAMAILVWRRRQKRRLDSMLDERIDQSFPASDPAALP